MMGGNTSQAKPIEQDEPIQTLVASLHRKEILPKAWIANTREGHRGQGLTVADGDKPIFTISAPSNVARNKGVINGRICQATVEAIYRWQSFPKNYKYPNKRNAKTLACKIAGNAVPPLGYQKIIQGLI